MEYCDAGDLGDRVRQAKASKMFPFDRAYTVILSLYFLRCHSLKRMFSTLFRECLVAVRHNTRELELLTSVVERQIIPEAVL